MRARGTKQVMAALLVAAVFIGLSLASCGTTVSVKTNSGDVVQGDLSGLAAMLRLADPTPQVGPAAQFDIPLSSIEQIWVDFPRVVIETIDRVLVGPFSAFNGVAQLLRVEQLGTVTEIPFTAVKQIAFNGEGFQALPREWLGQSWLNQRPYVVNKTVVSTGTAASAAVETEAVAADTSSETESTNTSSEVVWNGETTPVAPVTTPTTSGELPWWVLLIGVAVVFAAFFLIPTGGA